jgi:chromosome segregation ATPase
MSEKKVDALSESLLTLQTELAAFGDLYKNLDEAKASIERSGEELRGRANDQWASTRDFLELIRGAVDGIDRSSNKVVEVSESIIALASEIDRVDFPQRLDSIDSNLEEQSGRLHESSETLTGLFSSIKTQVDWLKGELTPLARQLPTRVAELSKNLETVSSRVDSTSAAISTQASALSTLQSATIREFEGLRREINVLSTASNDRHEALTTVLASIRTQLVNIGFGAYAILGFVAIAVWKVW